MKEHTLHLVIGMAAYADPSIVVTGLLGKLSSSGGTNSWMAALAHKARGPIIQKPVP